jgi:N-sulfoglucosamine sulfohydrolase
MRRKAGVHRRKFLEGCLVAGSSPFFQRVSGRQTQPNVVLIVTDDHGTDALGCYGNRIIRTPHLGGLARDGTRFTHAFCTSASCSPSRASVLTGLHTHANGQYGLQHDFHHFQSFDAVKSLPIFLEQAGYRTARIGKFHVAPEHVYRFQQVLSPGRANDMASIGRSPVEMAEASRSFIEESDPRPFFLYFCLDDPHRGLPFDTWPKPNPFGNRPEGYPGVTPVKYLPSDVIVPRFLPDNPECRAELAEYYQAVSRADEGIGRLLDILRKSGRYDQTLIIYISDNGIAFPGVKTTLYEAGMRLPCIIKTPNQQKRGMVNDAMVSWTDLAPTILDFAGARLQDPCFHGRSFRNIIEEHTPSGWGEVYASHTFHEIQMYYPMRVVRGRRFKLIWNLAYRLEFPLARDLRLSSTWQSVLRTGAKTLGKQRVQDLLWRPEYELYDLQEDPDEIRNLAQDSGFSKVLQEFKTKLQGFQSRTMDPWIADTRVSDAWSSGSVKWPR